MPASSEGIEFYEVALAAYYRARGAQARRIRTGPADSLHLLDMRGKGTLPPLMMLHGFSASGASQYGEFSKRLLPHVQRIVLPDLPGHGLSTVPAGGLFPAAMLEALLAALDAVVDEPTVIFASSMAGGLAVQAALRRPNKVRALALCSPSGAPFAPNEFDAFRKTFDVRTHGEALRFIDRLSPTAERAARGWPETAREAATRHVYAWGVRRKFKRKHFALLLDDVPRMRFLEPHELGALAMPVYLVWGCRDHILPPSQLAYYRAHLPEGATIETPAHFGHTPFLHHADELAARLLAFLRRV